MLYSCQNHAQILLFTYSVLYSVSSSFGHDIHLENSTMPILSPQTIGECFVKYRFCKVQVLGKTNRQNHSGCFLEFEIFVTCGVHYCIG